MDTKTALAIVIPENFHNDINRIRMIHDKAYPRWMPHINLIFPFIDTFESKNLELTLKKLTDDQTLIKLNEIDFFQQKGQYTYHLKTIDGKSIDNLNVIYNLCTEHCGWPKEKKAFHPHMTLAQGNSNNHNTMLEELNAWLLKCGPLEFNIKYISHLKRTNIGNFYAHKNFVTSNNAAAPVDIDDIGDEKSYANLDTYICIDNSGSTGNCKEYWDYVQKLVNKNHKILAWGSNTIALSYSATEFLIKTRAGSSGLTRPQTFIEHVPEKSNLIIITDGHIEANDVTDCDNRLKDRIFSSVEVHFFNTFYSKFPMNLSVAIPFIRNAKIYKIYKDKNCIASGSSNMQLDLKQYYNDPEKLIKDAEQVYNLIVVKNIGKINEGLKEELLALQSNLLRFIANKNIDSNHDQLGHIRSYLKNKDLDNAILQTNHMIESLDNSLSGQIEKILQKLISKCSGNMDFSFENLESSRVTRANNIIQTKPDEINEEEYKGDYECPISMDFECPILLIRKGEPVLMNLDKKDIDNYLNNPLFILHNVELVEKIKARIDHVFGLTTVQELFKQKDNDMFSPITRGTISSVLSFGEDISHKKATNYAMADIFFGKKLVGCPEMWLILLYNVISQMPYLVNDTLFMENFEKNMIIRLKDSVTNITLSGLGSISPLMKCTTDIAIWYCVSSPNISIGYNDISNRLRYFGSSAMYLLNILDLLGYPYHANTKKLVIIYKAFSWMMHEEKNNTQWRKLLWSQYQNSLTLVDGTVIMLDGNPNNKKDYSEQKDNVDTLNFKNLLDELTVEELGALSKMVDRNKSIGDVKIPTNLEPMQLLSVTNYSYPNNMVFPDITISPKTFRPPLVDANKQKLWSDCALEIYGQTYISLDKYFIDYVTVKNKYPEYDDFIKYISARQINKEAPVSTLPFFTENAVKCLFDRYEKVLGNKFMDVSVETFISTTNASRNTENRKKMESEK